MQRMRTKEHNQPVTQKSFDEIMAYWKRGNLTRAEIGKLTGHGESTVGKCITAGSLEKYHEKNRKNYKKAEEQIPMDGTEGIDPDAHSVIEEVTKDVLWKEEIRILLSGILEEMKKLNEKWQ